VWREPSCRVVRRPRRDDGPAERSLGRTHTARCVRHQARAHWSHVGPARLFVDVVGGYARKNYSTDRAIAFTNTFNVGELLTSTGVASGETDGNEYRAGVTRGG
jgi:hypothetical protein